MPPRPASQAETYSPYLTDPNSADSAVEVMQNIADQAPPIKATPPDLERAIAHIHELGWSLRRARDFPRASGGQP